MHYEHYDNLLLSMLLRAFDISPFTAVSCYTCLHRLLIMGLERYI